MNSFERYIYLTSIGWKDGDDIPTDEQIETAKAKAAVVKEKAKQAVLDKLGITADEAALLLG